MPIELDTSRGSLRMIRSAHWSQNTYSLLLKGCSPDISVLPPSPPLSCLAENSKTREHPDGSCS